MDSWDPLTPHSKLSDLAKIELKSDDPLDLFREWHAETSKFSTGLPNALCLSTVSKDSKASGRHVILRELDDEGFTIVTDKRSRKCDELRSFPDASMCFLWSYFNDKKEHVSRQVRIEGTVKELEPEVAKRIYDKEPLFCKIRTHVCRQGFPVDWDKMKEKHEKCLADVQNGKTTLPVPDYFVALKLIPTMVEFYYAHDHYIGDRMLFTRNSPQDPWDHERISA